MHILKQIHFAEQLPKRFLCPFKFDQMHILKFFRKKLTKLMNNELGFSQK